jgi:hypothetical protein
VVLQTRGREKAVRIWERNKLFCKTHCVQPVTNVFNLRRREEQACLAIFKGTWNKGLPVSSGQSCSLRGLTDAELYSLLAF